MEKPCARCGINPRNSTLKSYCVECKVALSRESRARCGGKRPQANCSRCGGERGPSRHPTYCKPCLLIWREERKLRPCARCGRPKDPSNATQPSYCYDCQRERWLLKKYGLTTDAFTAMLDSQGGVCAICGKPQDERSWHVDHDHATGAVRGILCAPCNLGLGHFADDLEVMRGAIAYLEANSSASPRRTA